MTVRKQASERMVASGWASAGRISGASPPRTLEKKFWGDYPRGLANWLWLCWFPALDQFSVAPALPIPFYSVSVDQPASSDSRSFHRDHRRASSRQRSLQYR